MGSIRLTAIGAAIMAALATVADAEPLNPLQRLGKRVEARPEATAGALLASGRNLFADSWLNGNFAYFMKKPLPVANLPDVCGQEGMIIVLDEARRATGLNYVTRYAEVGSRGGPHPSWRRVETCDKLQPYSEYVWAPSGRVMARALDLLRAAASASQSEGSLPFAFICAGGQRCPDARRPELAAMDRYTVVRVSTLACEPEHECYELYVWNGGASQRDEWIVKLFARSELERVELSEKGFFVEDAF